MGAKYLPSKKDLKASQRFQQKQLTESKFIRPAGPRTTPDAPVSPVSAKKSGR